MSELTQNPDIWQQLWDHDPNGLVVVDRQCVIRLNNRAFGRLFDVDPGGVIGRPVGSVIGDGAMFTRTFQAMDQGRPAPRSEEMTFGDPPRLFELRLFALREPDVAACIFVDMTERLTHDQALAEIKSETLEQVEAVVDKHMKVAQQIAGLLGEATAETKVSLLKLMAMLRGEDG
jgi:hypothetical protein